MVCVWFAVFTICLQFSFKKKSRKSRRRRRRRSSGGKRTVNISNKCGTAVADLGENAARVALSAHHNKFTAFNDLNVQSVSAASLPAKR